jgi:putative ABC transport system substrate-binding protein
MLVNPANPANLAAVQGLEPAAQRRGIEIRAMRAQTVAGIEAAFATLPRERPEAIVVALDPLFIQQVPQIAGLARKHRMPSIFANREFAEAGGLMSYGQNQVEIYERAAGYVDRILRGARPADMAVEQATKLELVVNRGTARAIGVDLPREVLLRADTVIE